MDNVSGLADESKKFVAFLTVTSKYNYSCVYIFHTVFPEKSNWRLILPQTNIFNIFCSYKFCSYKCVNRRKLAYYHFPYLNHVKNSTLNKIIKNGIVDDVELQKYLLATGLLQDSIQQSLDMVVIDRFLIMVLLEEN